MNWTQDKRRRTETGFSLVELLVVVAIIVILAAISLPAIGSYVRNYQIRGATQQVAAEIQTARTKAIMKNVNLGVLFVVLDPTTYRWVVMDDPTQPGVQRPFDQLVLIGANEARQAGAIRSLPNGVLFDSTGATTSAVGFTRLGAQCAAGTQFCGDLTNGPATPYVSVVNGAATITLTHLTTGLRRTISVTPGGRVLSQP